MKFILPEQKEQLEIANKKSLELNNNSNEIKDIVNNLRNTLTNKEKMLLDKLIKIKYLKKRKKKR